MSTTLTNGLKLPDKGSVDWYSDMQNNYTILDGAVGTIAEHTTALAGKAPAVHTHTKADITDFPAYGNAAGTICEGNDSRLSDARTPVAHTHTKSDVTDLFNSANTWSVDQTFSTKILTKTANAEIAGEDIYQCLKSDGKRAISFRVSNNSNYRILLLGVHDTNNSPPKGLVISNDNSNNITIFSDQPDGLGTSTNKWKSLNGINPGVLSLPDMGTTVDVNYFDFTSTITPLDGTDIFYRPPVDGWMTIIIAGTALALFEDASSSNPHVQGSGVTAAPVKGYCEATIPVHKNVRVKINAIGTSVYMAQVRPCMGNV